jgi:very-short-patch-repair endonuclease
VGPYIVDFYCPEYGVVIELDGGHHALPMTRLLMSNGPPISKVRG